MTQADPLCLDHLVMPRHPPKYTQTIQIRSVPKRLWKEVRRAAFKRGQSIQEFVVAALQMAIAEKR